MTSADDAPAAPAPTRGRRRFAAKRGHRGWGVGLSVFGCLGVLAEAREIVGGPSEVSNPWGGLVIALACSALGIYLLRGRGNNLRARDLRAIDENHRAAVAAPGMTQALSALAAASGGAAVVAYRNLEATTQSLFRRDWRAKLEGALGSVDYDRDALSIPRLGSVPTLSGGHVELFRDWVIVGQVAHDLEPSTRGEVHVDGAVQVTSAVVTDRRNRGYVVNQNHDLRTVQLQLTSSSWAFNVAIPLEALNDARMLVAQVSASVEALRPPAATASDIRAMVNAIVNNAGQPPADKLRQLSNLRYEHLLSDEEFERAKGVILGI